MTLIQSLARKAAPCAAPATCDQNDFEFTCRECRLRPAIEAVLTEAIEKAAQVASLPIVDRDTAMEWGYNTGVQDSVHAIRALLTKDQP